MTIAGEKGENNSPVPCMVQSLKIVPGWFGFGTECITDISANNSAKISIPNISVNVPAEWWEEMEEEGVADKVIVLGQ